jgi:hypothetical protein
VTDVQAKYIAMFYGEEVLAAVLRHRFSTEDRLRVLMRDVSPEAVGSG